MGLMRTALAGNGIWIGFVLTLGLFVTGVILEKKTEFKLTLGVVDYLVLCVPAFNLIGAAILVILEPDLTQVNFLFYTIIFWLSLAGTCVLSLVANPKKPQYMALSILVKISFILMLPLATLLLYQGVMV